MTDPIDEHLTVEDALSDEKYRQILVDLCKEIDKEPDIDMTDEVLELCKRLKTRRK